ncbi:MAG: rhamnogalacturonan acetylesterase [Opitutaceae bacterium]
MNSRSYFTLSFVLRCAFACFAFLVLPFAPAAELAQPAIFIAGDSTAARSDSGVSQGWAAPFADYFDPAKVDIVNRARGGRSSRTFITEGLWDQLLADVKPGDFVIMQFGHNDGGPLNDERRARGTIRGVGEETEEIDNMLTGKHEVVHSYGWYLRKFISDTRAKGATPIVCPPVPRKIWKDGRIARGGEDSCAGWAEQVARSEGAPFVDLNALIAARYDELGKGKVDALFADAHTHTSDAGAALNAEMVARGLAALEANPLSGYELALAGEGREARGEAANPCIDGRSGPGSTRVSRAGSGVSHEPRGRIAANESFAATLSVDRFPARRRKQQAGRLCSPEQRFVPLSSVSCLLTSAP